MIAIVLGRSAAGPSHAHALGWSDDHPDRRGDRLAAAHGARRLRRSADEATGLWLRALTGGRRTPTSTAATTIGKSAMADEKSRLHRQFDAIKRMAPASRKIIDPLLRGRLRRLRLPIACLLIVGSFLSILPVFGLWMLPLGLMLLALDVPLLRPFVSDLLIRVRRRIDVWRHRARGIDQRRRTLLR